MRLNGKRGLQCPCQPINTAVSQRAPATCPPELLDLSGSSGLQIMRPRNGTIAVSAHKNADDIYNILVKAPTA